jgi:hypothetical protein
LIRRGDTVDLATQSMLVGRAWGITGIRVYPEADQAPILLPTAEVVTLYNHYHGNQRLRVRYDAAPASWRPEIRFSTKGAPCEQAALVDVVATRDQKRIYVHAINSGFDQPRRLAMRLDGFEGLPAEAGVFRLRFHTGAEFETTRTWTTKETATVPLNAAATSVLLPPRSVTILVFRRP